jgi:sirohydrochlorin cobaltochelatase
MRKWNKLPALLLAGVMALGLTTAALAADVTYADVAGTWSEEYVERMTELDLMEGRSAGSFAPNENMTRAELVLALYRLAGSPAISGKNPFDDVAGDAAYRDAVIWANEKGIASGRSQGVFDPDGDVQRQEIAKILNAFAAGAVGRKALTSRADVLSGYTDAAQVSGWARESMNWAVASEFITGSGGKLDPRGAATRAQMAAILCRYMDDASTGDASKDNPRNGDSIGENELLVVSFGTSYNDNRAATIGAVESAMETAFPDYAVRRGFTSNIIIEHIQRRDGVVIDDVAEALARAKANGVKNLLVQPTHLMNGYEYGDLVKELEACAGDFETVKIGAPLLTTDEDFAAVAQAMVDAAAGYDDGKTAVCYMGHGSEAAANGIYARMQQHLTGSGHDNFFVGTVEAEPTAEDLVKLVKAAGYEKVVLRPMMIVAGDHANNDMAGDGEDSWKSVFTAAGFQVTCEINGLGELEAIQQLLAAHAGEAKPLDETGIYVEPNPGNVKPAGTAAPADGVYTVEVTCKESMFKIAGCELTIADGKMTAALTLGSASFDRMFPGSAAAASAGGEGAVEAVTDGETATFTLPVSALDQELGFAAHSVRKDTWYDRSLTFHAESLQAK